MRLGLFSLLLLLRLCFGTSQYNDEEKCASALAAIFTTGNAGENQSLSWGDIGDRYRAAVCGDWRNEAKYATHHAEVLEAVMFNLGRTVSPSLLLTDGYRKQELCNYLDAFVVGAGCNENLGESSSRRRAQDESCALDLLNFAESDTDGQLNLIEYNHFFSSRYYSRCGLSFDVDDTTGVSTAQSDAFVSLSCLSCLREIGTVTTLPDCCRPELAQISLSNPDAFTFSRICATARAAAAEDCSHLSLFTTAQPQATPPTSPPLALPPISFTPPSAIRPTPVSTSPMTPQSNGVPTYQIPTESLSECSRQLVVSDSSPSDGVLSSSEFTAFLVHRFGQECVLQHPEMSIQGLFLQLSCSSCLSGVGATLDCCLPNVARVSISDAYSGQESNWIDRICFNADAQVEATCTATAMTSPVVQPVPRPQSKPTTVNVIQPQVPSPVFRPAPPPRPATFAPVRIPSMTPPQSEVPSDPPTTDLQEVPTSRPSAGPVDMGRHSSPSPTEPLKFPTRSPIAPIIITAQPSAAPKTVPATTVSPAAASNEDDRVNATTTVANTTSASGTFSLPPIAAPAPTASSAAATWATAAPIIVGIITVLLAAAFD